MAKYQIQNLKNYNIIQILRRISKNMPKENKTLQKLIEQ